jgi:hypothetical protein
LLAKASTLIWAGASLDELISGCILDHEGNIICTHLDVDTTRWICNFLCTDPGRIKLEMVVYLPTSKVNTLLDQRREFFRAKHEFSDRIPENIEPGSEMKDEIIPVRLLFVHRSRVSICMLAGMNVPTFNAFHRLDSLANDINALEASICRIDAGPCDASSSQPNSEQASPSHSGSFLNNAPSAFSSPIRSSAGSSPTPSTPATPPPQSPSGHFGASPVLAVSSRTISRGLPASPRTETGGFHPPLKTSSSGALSGGTASASAGAKNQAYNYLSFSEETHTQEGNIGVRKPDAERQFFESLSFVHDTFNETPQITKIVYRDQPGTIFCRKLFGKETYFQQLAAGHSTKFAHFEERAREFLSQEHSVFLI